MSKPKYKDDFWSGRGKNMSLFPSPGRISPLYQTPGDLFLVYDSDGMLRLRLDLTCEGAQHTEEVAMGGPSDIVHGASRHALQVV